MLKVCIKHFIYDFCIKVFFDKVKSNFRSVILRRVPRVGECLAKVSHRYDDEHYYNCTIRNVQKHTSDKKETYYIINLKYQSSGGKVFQESDDNEDEDYDDEYDVDDWEALTDDFDKDAEKLLNEGELDAIDRETYLSIRYERYVFFK